MIIRRTPAIRMFDRLFDEMTRELAPLMPDNVEQEFALALDVTENDTHYTVKTALPGVNVDDINIRLHNNVLTISAKIEHERKEEQEGRVVMQELRYGSFSRSVRFPADVDGDKVDANYTDGILTLTIHKAQEAQPRMIRINKTNVSAN